MGIKYYKNFNARDELRKLRTAALCAARNIEVTEPDELGHIFCLLPCSGCGEQNFCLSVKRQFELELNRKAEVREIVGSKKG